MRNNMARHINKRLFSTALRLSARPLSKPSHRRLADEQFNAIKVSQMVDLFRSRGHNWAALDPLLRPTAHWWNGSESFSHSSDQLHMESLLKSYPGGEASLQERHNWIAAHLGLKGDTSNTRDLYFFGEDLLTAGMPRGQAWWGLVPLFETLRDVYCSSLGLEFSHVEDRDQQLWLAQHFEQRQPMEKNEQLRLLRNLIAAHTFETYSAEKFPQVKRFGLEGCESLIPGLETLVRRSAEHGVQRIEIGANHRGRLNILGNVVGKPLGQIFTEMTEQQSKYQVGDVKYHLGNTGTRTYQTENAEYQVRLSLAPNPSHLEAVAPVVMGMVRGQQKLWPQGKVMGLLIHGDGAFSGLGAVSECLQLSKLRGYSAGGFVHVIVNNQVGFTTTPGEARNSMHPTDIAKAYQIPIVHANADSPESVDYAFQLAADYRNEFGRDFVVDVVGYRRNGHNELENPVPADPQTYNKLSEHLPVAEWYDIHLRRLGILSDSKATKFWDKAKAKCETEFIEHERGSYEQSAEELLTASWQSDALLSLAHEKDFKEQGATGLPTPTLQWTGQALCRVPVHWNLHFNVREMLRRRLRMVDNESSRVDMAMAEALAYGTLALHRQANFGDDYRHHMQEFEPFEGNPRLGLNHGHFSVRLCGQDSERGTFNQRLAVVKDIASNRKYELLNMIIPDQQEPIKVWNSPLAEYAPLGFEYGYSLACRDSCLVIWEAQFGDFANNAQTIIDCFIATGEEKWGQMSGLVLMLPHGFTGLGPDHSSARIERFLQLVNDHPNAIPGKTPAHQLQIRMAFDALNELSEGNKVRKHDVAQVLSGMLGSSASPKMVEANINQIWDGMHLGDAADIRFDDWERIMSQYIRANAENEANMIIVQPSTPAQLFHVLRLQVNRGFMKPLILLSPKWLFHHRKCTSQLEDFGVGTKFRQVISDGMLGDNNRHLYVDKKSKKSLLARGENVKRLVLCTGQVYYKLDAERRRLKLHDILFVRLEQIAPFPFDPIVEAIAQYPNAQLVWCQEEPKNMGAWNYVQPRLHTVIREFLNREQDIYYAGRPVSASACTASPPIYQRETRDLINDALDLRDEE